MGEKNSQCNNPEILESTIKQAQVETVPGGIFSKEAWERNEDQYNNICQLPYHQEMARGELKLEVFQHYLIQDAHYLKRCAESMNILANGLKNDQEKVYFENRHESWSRQYEIMLSVTFQKYGLTRENFDKSVISACTERYCDHIRKAALIAVEDPKRIPVFRASLLPCYWLWYSLGRELLSIIDKEEQLNPDHKNCYRDFVEKNISRKTPTHIAEIDKMAAHADEETRQLMHEAFDQSVECEKQMWIESYLFASNEVKSMTDEDKNEL